MTRVSNGSDTPVASPAVPDALSTVGEAMDFHQPVEPETLRRAREVWGLDAAPLAPLPQRPKPLAHLKPGQRRRVAALMHKMGTPGDVARAMMAKPVPAEWARELRELSPVSSAASHLLFAWKQPPLEPDRGRWCLYEAIPDALISVERRLELESPPYWTLPKEARAGQARLVSAYQWLMYHDHRLDVRPFWCLQGTEGGTALAYTSLMRRYRILARQSPDPLAVGDLPYAPWDGRVRAAVAAEDRLRRMNGSLDRLRASGNAEAVRAAIEAEEREFRRVFWDTLGERLAFNVDLYTYILKHETPDRVRQTEADAIAAAEARDYFIEFGRVPDPIEFRDRARTYATR